MSSKRSPYSSKTRRADNEWNSQGLLELSDIVRETLTNGQPLGPDSEELPLLLEALVAAEVNKSPTITFDTIREAALDKLLEDIQDGTKGPSVVPPTFQAVTYMAKELQKHWKSRFTSRYLFIDELRRTQLITSGRLRGVRFSINATGAQGIWRPKDIMSSTTEGSNGIPVDTGQ